MIVRVDQLQPGDRIRHTGAVIREVTPDDGTGHTRIRIEGRPGSYAHRCGLHVAIDRDEATT